jgi:hypothetical protein
MAMPIVALADFGVGHNPRNISHMPAVKIFARLELDETIERTNWCASISGWTPGNPMCAP